MRPLTIAAIAVVPIAIVVWITASRMRALAPTEENGVRPTAPVAVPQDLPAARVAPIRGSTPMLDDEEKPAAAPFDPTSVATKLGNIAAQGRPMADALLVVRLNELTADEAPHAFDFLAKLNDSGKATPDMWHTFWARWGVVDVERALDQAAAGVPRYNESDRAVKQIFGGLATADPAAASQYILEHPEMRERHRAVEGMSARWSRVDPEAATRFALGHLAGEDLGNAMHAIPWGINATQGHGAALSWWQTLQSEETQAAAYVSMAEIFGGQSEANVEDRIELVEAGFASGHQHQHLLAHVGSELATDPERGFGILGQAPYPPGEGSAWYPGIEKLFTTWGQGDPVAAAESLSRHLHEPWADTAILGYARALRHSDPEAAEWVEQIRDESVRGIWNP